MFFFNNKWATKIGTGWGNPNLGAGPALAGNKKLVLPVPAFIVINGGSHAGTG
jgi:hypothetical protein